MNREIAIQKIESLLNQLRSENELTYIRVSEKVLIEFSPFSEGERLVIKHDKSGETSINHHDNGVNIHVYSDDEDSIEPIHSFSIDSNDN